MSTPPWTGVVSPSSQVKQPPSRTHSTKSRISSQEAPLKIAVVPLDQIVTRSPAGKRLQEAIGLGIHAVDALWTIADRCVILNLVQIENGERTMHRTQDTYSLSHFRQHTTEHLKRLTEGRVETITQNGQAAMIVMSPETYDLLRTALERGDLWEEAITRFAHGERGVEASEALEQIAARLNLKL